MDVGPTMPLLEECGKMIIDRKKWKTMPEEKGKVMVTILT